MEYKICSELRHAINIHLLLVMLKFMQYNERLSFKQFILYNDTKSC